MANNLFSRFGNQPKTNNNMITLLAQANQLQNDPGKIIDIMRQRGKITESQYSDLQQYKNNPQQIFQYMINNGSPAQVQQLRQFASLMNKS